VFQDDFAYLQQDPHDKKFDNSSESSCLSLSENSLPSSPNLVVKDNVARVNLEAGVNSSSSEMMETTSALDIKHNEHFVKSVFIPYITDVFKDHAERAKGANESSSAGINRLTFL